MPFFGACITTWRFSPLISRSAVVICAVLSKSKLSDGRLLVVPDVVAGLGVDGDHRRGEQIVPAARGAVSAGQGAPLPVPI